MPENEKPAAMRVDGYLLIYPNDENIRLWRIVRRIRGKRGLQTAESGATALFRAPQGEE